MLHEYDLVSMGDTSRISVDRALFVIKGRWRYFCVSTVKYTLHEVWQGPWANWHVYSWLDGVLLVYFLARENDFHETVGVLPNSRPILSSTCINSLSSMDTLLFTPSKHWWADTVPLLSNMNCVFTRLKHCRASIIKNKCVIHWNSGLVKFSEAGLAHNDPFQSYPLGIRFVAQSKSLVKYMMRLRKIMANKQKSAGLGKWWNEFECLNNEGNGVLFLSWDFFSYIRNVVAL